MGYRNRVSAARRYVVGAGAGSAPAAPTGNYVLTVDAFTLAITVGFTANAATINISRSTSESGTYIVVKSGLVGLTWEDTGLSAATTYWYKAQAVNTFGSSPWSAAFYGTTLTGTNLDPALTNLRRAVKHGLEQITPASGYYNKVREVNIPPKSPEEMNKFVSVNLIFGPEICANADELGRGGRGSGNEMKLHNHIDAQIDCWMKDMNDPDTAREKMVADVQKRFGNFYYVQDSNGIRRAFDCVYLGHDPWGTEGVTPNCGVTISYRYIYRILMTNPTALA